MCKHGLGLPIYASVQARLADYEHLTYCVWGEGPSGVTLGSGYIPALQRRRRRPHRG